MKNKKGITLLELIVSIVIIAICFGVVSTIYGQVLGKIHKSRTIVIANALAEEKMDEVLGDEYLGIGNDSDNFSSPFGDYSYQVVVSYVDAADLNTSVAGPTPYKNVEVRVSHSEIETIEIISLLTDYTN